MVVSGDYVYAAYRAYNAAGSHSVYLARSADGGHTYEVSTLYDCNYPESCWVEANLARPEGAPPDDPELYAVVKIDRHLYLYHSTDRGETWAAHLARDTEPGGECMLHPLLAVDAATGRSSSSGERPTRAARQATTTRCTFGRRRAT
jgi:hypothetical protein